MKVSAGYGNALHDPGSPFQQFGIVSLYERSDGPYPKYLLRKVCTPCFVVLHPAYAMISGMGQEIAAFRWKIDDSVHSRPMKDSQTPCPCPITYRSSPVCYLVSHTFDVWAARPCQISSTQTPTPACCWFSSEFLRKQAPDPTRCEEERSKLQQAKQSKNEEGLVSIAA